MGGAHRLMDIVPVITGIGVGTIASGLVAFGIVKGKLYNYVDYRTHEQICSKAKDGIYKELRSDQDKIMNFLMEMKQDIGFIKGRVDK